MIVRHRLAEQSGRADARFGIAPDRNVPYQLAVMHRVSVARPHCRERSRSAGRRAWSRYKRLDPGRRVTGRAAKKAPGRFWSTYHFGRPRSNGASRAGSAPILRRYSQECGIRREQECLSRLGVLGEPLRALGAECVPVVRRFHPRAAAPGSPPTSGLKYESGTGIITAMLTTLRARCADGRLGPAAPPVEQAIGHRGPPERQHAKGRQEEPDAVMARRVRQAHAAASRTPSARRSRARSARFASVSARSPSPVAAMIKNPTGVTKTVQTSVLYHGSDSSGVL